MLGTTGNETGPRRTRHRAGWGAALLGALVLAGIGGLIVGDAPSPPSVHAQGAAMSPAAGVATSSRGGGPPEGRGPLAAAAPTVSPGLTLGIGVGPAKICADLLATCPAATGLARVTLTANAAASGPESWPDVQVAFVLETTPYDGVADAWAGDPGQDPCMPSSLLVCEESNGVPFFVANAQLIAEEIQASNPHSAVSFALVDYFATLNDHDDGDGSEYHVDIQNFVPGADFGAAVTSTFQAQVLAGGWVYSDSDMADNTLDSSSITALYGTIIGSDLSWSNATHHVIVWMGSTAPRDPNYLVDYGVSASDPVFPGGSNASWSSGCEPSYAFASGASPNCEGWVRSQDGNPADSIAALARGARTCTDSIGGVCTIDTIDYWTTPTDYDSPGWPAGVPGGGPGGARVVGDVDHIIAAGCDIAAATGGTWDGPAGLACPNGQSGTLEYVPHGSPVQPDTSNPTLLRALEGIGFGPVIERQVAAGAGGPMFQFVPIGNIALPPGSALQSTAACVHDGAAVPTCQLHPTVGHQGDAVFLGWNWSTVSGRNVMQLGDSWTASFNVYATGAPFQLVPVDACTTLGCRYGGSTVVDGLYTAAEFIPSTNGSVERNSFPLGQVTVEPTPPVPPASASPSGAGAAPGLPVASANPLPITHAVGTGNPVGLPGVSLQAAAAGLLGAGFVRVGVRHRTLGIRIANRSPAARPRAGRSAPRAAPAVPGHFE